MFERLFEAVQIRCCTDKMHKRMLCDQSSYELLELLQAIELAALSKHVWARHY